MIIYNTIDVNVTEAVKSCCLPDRWELLQSLWDDLKMNGNPLDWESFYKDNKIEEKE